MQRPPIAREIAYRDPVALAAGWAETPYTLLFDSAAARGARSRYSYLCVDPVDTVLFETASEADADGPSPLDWIKTRLHAHRQPTRPDLPPFQGGVAGLLGYETGSRFERLPAPAARGAPHPAAAFAVYDIVVAFDHWRRRAWIVSTGHASGAGDPCLDRARARANALADRLRETDVRRETGSPAASALDWRSDVDRDGYIRRVRRAVDYIRAGDVFQVNVSREISADRPRDMSRFALYASMRARTLAPFSAYMALPEEMAVCSFSPERFLRVRPDGSVETRPIKGTRARGGTPDEDSRLAAELINSEKDRAENLMIVDLLRNDLSRVCRVGSVTVPQLHRLETFEAVHHLVSVVTGQLAPGRDASDLIQAAFPGGSITGAPKIRAMEIIHELEQRRRGPYCGSLFWLGFDGAMDSSILIRTMSVDRERIRYGVGGGIVSDSDPTLEWEETRVKAAAFVAATAHRGQEAHEVFFERRAS